MLRNITRKFKLRLLLQLRCQNIFSVTHRTKNRFHIICYRLHNLHLYMRNQNTTYYGNRNKLARIHHDFMLKTLTLDQIYVLKWHSPVFENYFLPLSLCMDIGCRIHHDVLLLLPLLYTIFTLFVFI